MHTKSRRGQSVLEYVILLTIIMGALIAAGTYLKRGIQGRWKESIDGIGDQYDPRVANSNLRHELDSNTTTRITIVDTPEGYWTRRFDEGNIEERKTGFTGVGSY